MSLVDEVRLSPADVDRRFTEYLSALRDSGVDDPTALATLMEVARAGVQGFLQPHAPGPAPHGFSPCVQSAVAFLHSHYSDRLTWRDVADSVCRHRGYLATLFRRETGTTMRRYLSQLRIRRAADLVASGEKIEFAMLSVGYHSKRTFYAQFRATMGMTPAEYRLSASGRRQSTS